MSKTGQVVRKFMSLSPGRKFSVLEQLIILTYTSLLVKVVPLRFYYHRYLEGQTPEREGQVQLFKKDLRQYYRLTRLVPWKVTCLMESIAFSIYFKRKGIHLPVYLGVKTGGIMEAHAWNFQSGGQGFSAINR